MVFMPEFEDSSADGDVVEIFGSLALVKSA
jgi:hypothetical protein